MCFLITQWEWEVEGDEKGGVLLADKPTGVRVVTFTWDEAGGGGFLHAPLSF